MNNKKITKEIQALIDEFNVTHNINIRDVEPEESEAYYIGWTLGLTNARQHFELKPSIKTKLFGLLRRS